MKKQFILILFLIFTISNLYAGKEYFGDLKNANNPEMMVSDGQSLFVLDGIKVYQYDLKTMILKNSFGKKGNGPGEFKTNFINKLRIKLVQNKIMLSNFNKISFFTKAGSFIREIRLPFTASQICPVGDNLLITRVISGKKGLNSMGVVLYNKNMKQIKILYSKPEISPNRSRRYDAPNEMIFAFYNKYIYIADQRHFTIHVFDAKGSRVREIKKNYPIVSMTAEYKKEVFEWFESLWLSRFKAMADSRNLTKASMKKMIFFHKKFPAFRSMSLHKDEFYIETFIKKGVKSKFIIFDTEGNNERYAWLSDSEPGRIKMMTKFTYMINKGYYFYFRENTEKEIWEVFRESI